MENVRKIAKDTIVIHESKEGVRSFVTDDNILLKIGKNANKVIRATNELQEDRKVLKFRKYGKIEIYIK